MAVNICRGATRRTISRCIYLFIVMLLISLALCVNLLHVSVKSKPVNYHDVYYKRVVVLMMRYRQSNKTWGRMVRTLSWLIIRNDVWVCKWCQCLAIYYWLIRVYSLMYWMKDAYFCELLHKSYTYVSKCSSSNGLVCISRAPRLHPRKWSLTRLIRRQIRF